MCVSLRKYEEWGVRREHPSGDATSVKNGPIRTGRAGRARGSIASWGALRRAGSMAAWADEYPASGRASTFSRKQAHSWEVRAARGRGPSSRERQERLEISRNILFVGAGV